MGAYLSEPKVEKFSTDEMSEFLSVGASSMQGWRNSQEDAHNSILNFDKNTSFFAVYDGHGGAEVAAHCADKLPEFLKNLEAYKNGDFELALKDAFLGFDATLLEEDVIQILKILAGERNVDMDDSTAEDDDAEVENLAELREEGILPLDAVLEKYKGVAAPAAVAATVAPSMPVIKKLIDGPSGSKPQSPYLRGRRRQENDESASCSSKLKSDEETPETTLAQNSKMEVDVDSTVSSSSSNQIKETCDKKVPVTANGSSVTCSPDSSVKVAIKESVQNGSVTSAKAVTSEGVSSSDAAASNEASPAVSSAKPQNGEVSSPSQACDAAPATSSEKSPVSALNRAAKKVANSGISSTDMDDDSSCDSDADFQAEENSSTDEETRGVGFGSDDDEDDDDEDDDEEEEEDEDDVEDALANEKFCANMIEEPGKDSGCTAVVALLHGRDLYVANAGDSRCVVCRNGKAIEMSLDHKPEDELESNRITKAGGRVTLDGRVNGGLNLSRAIGDHAYKMNSDLLPEEQMISALPDVKKLIIDKDDEFMILACDGIWNFMSSEEVVQFVREKLQDGNKKVSQVCEELFDKCLAPNTLGDGTGCDNMTAVIVRFKDQLLSKPTKLKVEETEPVLLAKQIAEADAADVSLQQSLKRSASPSSADNTCDSENSNKRLKTDDEAAVSNVAECDSGTSSSTSSSTSSAATSSTAAASTTSSTSSTT